MISNIISNIMVNKPIMTHPCMVPRLWTSCTVLETLVEKVGGSWGGDLGESYTKWWFNGILWDFMVVCHGIQWDLIG